VGLTLEIPRLQVPQTINVGGIEYEVGETRAFELDDGTTRTFYYLPKLAQRAVDFFPMCLRHVKGEWAGQPIKLEKWQEDDIIRPAFGWVDEFGLRRYRVVYVEIPRKNGKSTLSAGVALNLTVCDHEPGAEVYSAAADKDQARIVFGAASDMRDSSSLLSEELAKFKNSLFAGDSNSVYRVLSADAFSKHGLNAHGVIFDEFHTQPNRNLWDVLLTSRGSRRQPMVFVITTAGYDRNSVCWEQHDYAIKVRDGIFKDPTFLPVIYSAEEHLRTDEDAWKKEETWKFANPNYGLSLKPEYVKEEFARALKTPAYENTFKRLQLNIWTEQATRWMPMAVWDKLGEPLFTERQLRGRECVAGFDLASSIDICSLVLLFPPIKKNEPHKVLCHFWVPELRAKERTEKQRIPYQQWIHAGLMKATPGNVTDYDFIRKDINDLGDKFKIKEIGYDPWNASQIVTQLEGDGYTMVPVRQGFASLSAPTKHLMTMALAGDIDHNKNPILRWMASNVAVKQDAAGNLKPDREHSSEKIDGIVALIIAVSRLIVFAEPEKSVYETRGVLSL
jgi:phage terminase large subunit-like protein